MRPAMRISKSNRTRCSKWTVTFALSVRFTCDDRLRLADTGQPGRHVINRHRR
jgi:hypothetical protein